MEITLPAGATDARAAVLRGWQDDVLMLAFTVPTERADAFVEGLSPERELKPKLPLKGAETKSSGDSTGFAHLGLPEPDTLKDVRAGWVCLDCNKAHLDSLEVAVHRLDDRNSRVYLSGTD
ncbi:hypothetical protein GCM10010218_28720 [Streptomyces mashuensis]|uniref:Uncharacterized protein n=1 Tax=Streptomyces mashuensis TaxID=33904 RepID=A0A919ED76_9ACTN|nr:hypothetical protein [Streptomyces mashuensis]GHF45768.1 hypothetical protein GCM10010218_28720 [Streptomyces mashuensis]